MKLRVSIAIGIFSTAGIATIAAADTFVNPLSTVPKPNVVIGFDHSVTMGIQTNCGACHGPAQDAVTAVPRTRLGDAKDDLLQTAPLFRDYFTFGAFTYKGCGYAEITNRILPTPANPDTSFEQIFGNPVGSGGLIPNLTHCGSRENSLPNSASAWTSCITPTTGCIGDLPIIQQILSGTPPGITFTQPTITATTCDNPISPVATYDIQASLLSKLAGGGYTWPRWDQSSLNAAEVDMELCQPLENVLLQVQNELSQCLLNPTAVWDMSFLSTDWCQEAVIANTACTAWPTANTCVCDQTVVGPTGETCFTAGMISSDCGIPLVFKARQQIAICELYNVQPGGFGDFYQNQPDNHVNGPQPDYCRENVGMIFTDGYMGDTSGVAAEAAAAIPTYLSVSGLSNLFVFRISSVFNGSADAMQGALAAGTSGLITALDATDAASMQASFAQVLSRIFKGVYTGASMTLDEFGTRAYVNSFTVPGYSDTGPVTDTYIGWPQRISAYAVDPTTGAISTTPLWETDWSSRVSASSCGPTTIGTPDVSLFGPGGTFRNGVPRTVNINTPIDRNGDGTPDPIPPGSGGYTWGRAYGFAATEPVVVGAPREAVGGDQAVSFAAFQNNPQVRQRRRVVYVQAGGYVIGYDAGDYDSATPTYGITKTAFSYNEDGNTGAEIMRYTPGPLLNDPYADYQYGLNDLVQQPILNGDLEAREVFDGTQWRTVLAGSGGLNSRIYFTLDVTDPCSPSLIGEWRLPYPQDRASNEPRIYTVPTPSGPRPALIVTGGLRGTSNLYAYRLDGTNHYAAFPLTPGANASYAVTPVCVDTRGEGYVTHCYALRSDGRLSRVQVTATGFTNEVDVTPTGGSVSPIDGVRKYYTMPVAFFSADGTVNLVFGSGDFENLTTAPATQNYVFKVKDEGIRKRTVPNTATNVTTSCYDSGGSTEGIFPLANNERMISSPVVVGGGVFWTGYQSTTNGCISGTGSLYGMNYESCYDILTPTAQPSRPAPKPIGPGIPLTPTIHRASNTVYTQTTAGPTAGEIAADPVRLRGGLRPIVKRLYWRPFVDIR